MNCLTNCPSCKHAIFWGYGNGYGCQLAECRYELATFGNHVIASSRSLTEEEIKLLMDGERRGE